MMPAEPKTVQSRLPFLDWTRGLVAVIMLQGHTLHSFAKKELQDSAPYVFSQFVGGLAPAVFLFLTGVTYGFLMTRSERRGLPWRVRLTTAWRRAGYLLALAFAFRLQLWLFAYPQSPWQDIFKVDILNCMALSLFLFGPLALVDTGRRVRWALLAGLAVTAAAPVVSSIASPAWPPALASYFVPNFNYFGFFPWAAFVAFGIVYGTVLRAVSPEAMNRAMQWSALVGMALFLLAKFSADFPYTLYTKSEFWLDSPSLTGMKMAIILMLLPLAYLWEQAQPAGQWSVLRQFGTTSLLVYWVHIEIVYGRWFGDWKQSLTIAQCALFAAILIVCMLGVSLARTRWSELRTWAGRRFPLRQPSPITGD